MQHTLFCRPLLALLILALAPQAAPAASSATDGPVGLTPIQASRFKTALAALARQGHVCIVAEDAPLSPTLAPDKAPAVPDRTPLGAAVARVADAYDYDAVRTGGVFTLTKRYTDPADLPDVTLPECAEDVSNVSLAASVFDPPQISGPQALILTYGRMQAILDGLSPEQQQAVFSPAGVPVSEIGEEGRAALDRWNLGMYLDAPTNTASSYAAAIKRAGQASFGVSTVSVGRPDGTSTLVSTFGWRGSDSHDNSGFTFLAESMSNGQDPSGGPVTPEEKEAARARVAQRQGDGRETLAQAVAALAVRGPHDEVNPALAAKRVTVAGDGNAAPDAVLAALAQVYGLRVRLRQSDGVTVLDLPERVTPPDVPAVRATVLSLLPAPLLRASHLLDTGDPPPGSPLARLKRHVQALTLAMGRVPRGALSVEQGMALFAAQKELSDAEQARQNTLRYAHLAAARAVRVAVESAPPSAKVDGMLPGGAGGGRPGRLRGLPDV